MTQKTFRTALNLEARAAALFVQNANKFPCKLTLKHENMEVNCKSIMGVVSMTIYEGQEITITGNGTNESEAVETLAKMLAEA